MLWNASLLDEFTIAATDGTIGRISDCLFDDETMAVRWFVLDTGKLFPGRKVLIPPGVTQPDTDRRVLRIDMTIADIEDSPDLDADAPVSRQHEQRLHDYHRWEPYWLGGPYAPGAAAMAIPVIGAVPPQHRPDVPQDALQDGPGSGRRREGDPHLRSAREVTGYYIHATDGDLGHVEDLLIDPGDWLVRYFEVDTRNWWPGKKVLISTHAVTGIDHIGETVALNLTRDQIRGAPEYDPAQTIDRAFEQSYYGYYGYPAYWS